MSIGFSMPIPTLPSEGVGLGALEGRGQGEGGNRVHAEAFFPVELVERASIQVYVSA